jgi:hypothetical protein
LASCLRVRKQQLRTSRVATTTNMSVRRRDRREEAEKEVRQSGQSRESRESRDPTK